MVLLGKAFVAPLPLILFNRIAPHPTFSYSKVRMLSADSQRPSLDDVDRLSRGQAAKRRGTGSRAVPHRLNAEERESYQRAIQCGFLTLGSNLGSRRERKGSPLFNIWRMWNDAQSLPAIFFIRRGTRLPSDQVWADLSTLLRPTASLSLNSPDITDLVKRVDDVTSVSGSLHADSSEEYLVELDHSELFVPTWQIPELWLKYCFEDRSEAKQAAQCVSTLFGTASKTKLKVKSKQRQGGKARRLAEQAHDDIHGVTS